MSSPVYPSPVAWIMGGWLEAREGIQGIQGKRFMRFEQERGL